MNWTVIVVVVIAAFTLLLAVSMITTSWERVHEVARATGAQDRKQPVVSATADDVRR